MEDPLITYTRNKFSAYRHSDMESGWLIERSTGRGPAYIFVDSNEMLGWTHDNLRAIRFARREDAEQVARMVDDAEKITEHQWG